MAGEGSRDESTCSGAMKWRSQARFVRTSHRDPTPSAARPGSENEELIIARKKINTRELRIGKAKRVLTTSPKRKTRESGSQGGE